MKYFLPFLFTILLSSCLTFHNGSISSGPLLGKQDKYVDNVSGQARAVNVLFIGGKNKNSLVSDAKKVAFKNRPLKLSEYYSNFTCDIKKTIVLGIVFVTKVVVTVDILASADNSATPFSPEYEKFLNPPAPAVPVETKKERRQNSITSCAMEKDSVFYSGDNKNYALYVVSSIQNDNVMLLPVDNSGQNTLISTDKKLFIKTFEFQGIKSGDKVVAETINSYNSATTVTGILIGMCDGFFLIKMQNGYTVAPLLKLRKI